jgi:hypothetical protein
MALSIVSGARAMVHLIFGLASNPRNNPMKPTVFIKIKALIEIFSADVLFAQFIYNLGSTFGCGRE